MTTHLVDANVWIALAVSEHTHHRIALGWLSSIDEPRSLLFCRATQQTFLRLLTNAAVLSPFGLPPRSNSQAWEAFDALLADDRIVMELNEPAGLERTWRAFASRPTASIKLWMDSYLAAFALLSSHRLVTVDAAFSQFRDLDLLILR